MIASICVLLKWPCACRKTVRVLAAAMLMAGTFSSLQAQPQLRFEPLSLEQGVSHDLVFALAQDRQGFMWLGTMYGLARYDGRRYTIFKHDPADSNSISFNDIIAIFQDRAGYLWIGTWGGGLNRFDPATQSFTRFVHDPGDSTSVRDNIVWAIVEDRAGNLWAGTQTGLEMLPPRPAKSAAAFRHFRLPLPAEQSAVRALREDTQGRLWVGTSGGGLVCLVSDKGKEQIWQFRHEPERPSALSSDDVSSLFQDHEGNLWIGTARGLNKMISMPEMTGEATFQQYRHEAQDPGSLSHDQIGPICEDSAGQLWVGTARGLNRFDPAAQIFMRFQHDPGDPNSLRTNAIVALQVDRTGLLWVGTYFGGVHKLRVEGPLFQQVRHQPGNDASLGAGPVHAIHLDRNGTLWVGTWGGGLNALPAHAGVITPAGNAPASMPRQTFVHYRVDPKLPNGLRSNIITALASDERDHLWVGTRGGGLTEFDAKHRMLTYRCLAADSTSLSSDNVLSLCIDHTGGLWIGTENGLNHLPPHQRQFIRYFQSSDPAHGLSDNSVHTIIVDRSGALWLGTYRGLSRFEPHTKTFVHYRHALREPGSLSNDYVYALHEDRAGHLWVGTSDGLNCLDRTAGSFTVFREKDGLPNGVICGILEDENGRLWLSTNRGLSCFDPRTRGFKNYDIADGLQSNLFSVGASCKNHTGEMYFGGLNGYDYFQPGVLPPRGAAPPVVVTAVKVFDKLLQPAQYLNTPLLLPHNSNSLSFEFAALDLAQPEKNQYAYRLEGLDREWVRAGTSNGASYAPMPPGHYVFHVKAADHNGVWNEKGAALTIVITPPFWRTWWFAGIFVIVLVLTALLGHLLRLQRERARIAEIERIKSAEEIRRFQEVEKARREEREHVRRRIAADFHDESGHKLTKISLFCGVLQSKLRAGALELDDYLERIMKTAASLHKDLSDFLWALDPAENTLHDTALKLKEFGDKLFESTGICFDMLDLAPAAEHTPLSMEARQNLTCIFKEGMHNALKHGGAVCRNVVFKITHAGGNFFITLADDGPGFDVLHEMRGHGLRNMQERARAAGGDLTIRARPGHGTTVQFQGSLSPLFSQNAPALADWRNGVKLN